VDTEAGPCHASEHARAVMWWDDDVVG
jgi:hypothetical protein